jgi:hypothetical protein
MARTWKFHYARLVMLPSSAWRLLLLPIVLLAFLLVGAPDFPALERAIQKAFEADPAHSRPSAFSGQASDRIVATRSVVAASPPELEEQARACPPKLEERRRGILVPLYASFAVLQALDAHSTLRALDAGATEANPLMGGLAGKPAALLAVKAGLAASTIYLVEKVRVKSRGAAIALMTVLNSAYASIVAHNYRVPR